MNNPHHGSSFDSFLKEDGIFDATEAVALKRVIAYQLSQEMKKKRISKIQLAAKMLTSRAQLDRLLDPSNISVSLKTLIKAAQALGKRLTLSFG